MMQLDYTDLAKLKPEPAKSIYFPNFMKRDGRGLQNQQYDKAWLAFLDKNGLRSIQSGSNIQLPPPQKELNRHTNIKNCGLAVDVDFSDGVSFGVVRYEQWRGRRQASPRFLYSLFFIPFTSNNEFFVHNKKAHALRLVDSALTKSFHKGYYVYSAETSQAFASEVAEIGAAGLLPIDVLCGNAGIWIMSGGDLRDAENLRQLYEISGQTAEVAGKYQGQVAGEVKAVVYRKLPLSHMPFRYLLNRFSRIAIPIIALGGFTAYIIYSIR